MTVTPPERIAVAFARLLRSAGLTVPLGNVTLFAQALGAVGLHRRESVYWAARATLLRRPEDIPSFDHVFAVFWLRSGGAAPGAPSTDEDELTAALAVDAPLGAGDDDVAPADRQPDVVVRWSPVEVLRHKDFAAYTADEFAEARRFMADLRLAGALRRSRRRRVAPHRGPEPDVRRTMRATVATGGEPIRRAWLSPTQRPRRVVLLLDVSGSMEAYSRALLRFLHAAVASRAHIEAFALGTRLTRITRELSWRDPDAALAAASRAVADWSGGTRLGDGLRAFNDQWGVRGLARGAVVVILSDGWDRGEPAALAEQMARLHRVAYRVVWVNPLKATAGYAPLARGMAAALPFVDDFVEGHSLAALQSLVAIIGRPKRGAPR